MGGPESVDHGQWRPESDASPTTPVVHYSAAAHLVVMMQGHDVHPDTESWTRERRCTIRSHWVNPRSQRASNGPPREMPRLRLMADADGSCEKKGTKFTVNVKHAESWL